ncbi:hypothetical protein PUNSTDRAFT_57635 [Punctularia strigosozonata HHB-11173 SS5]|uniref:uncharacterized protein n=1 Tax=Punctularia strigosozonata (strain HHB-11173) TaxID=741275 RepID=UPI0004418476|nr:uncharacterized protein PUNSTDRAFT_57635 [Punctularia strigosozonata HHB-11173 SS5]EIN13573.1 hypothetical protein PUNSTDRAFT_57635 [Punctularia strigosozonata HHB-11173 SS5]
MRRKPEAAWEVVDHRMVNPVPMLDEEEGSADVLELVDIADEELRATYLFDVHRLSKTQLRNAVAFAQHQLREELEHSGEFNVFMMEGWQLTLLRKGKKFRIKIQYRGLPARVIGKTSPPEPPPFLDLLCTLALS